MRVLLAGSAGQVARELSEAAARESTLKAFGRPSINLEKPETVQAIFDDFQPDSVINAAGYTAIDKAESKRQEAMRLNANASELLARLAAARGFPILHPSTDSVFAGGKAWPDAETRSELRIVADQQGAPSYAPDIADGFLRIISRPLSEVPAPWVVYHGASSGSCVWANFAKHLFASSGVEGGPSAEGIRIATAEYSASAKRPAYSRIDGGRLPSDYGVALLNRRLDVDRCVTRLSQQRRAA